MTSEEILDKINCYRDAYIMDLALVVAALIGTLHEQGILSTRAVNDIVAGDIHHD